jgi:two-component system NtrC family sensor kinase
MLARRSIRTKLLVVLGLMLTVVGILATSAFWGLYRYRGLADAISLQDKEIEQAHGLSRSAGSIRDIGHRISQLYGEQRSLDDSPLSDPRLKVELRNFDYGLDEFSRLLSTFAERNAGSRADELLFIEPAERRLRVQRLDAQLRRVVAVNEQPIFFRDAAALGTLHQELENLSEQTEELTSLVHHGMAVFSQEMRGQSRTWIAVAWMSLIGSILMFLMLCGLFHSLVVKPFRTLIGGSRLVAAGEFDHRIDLGTGDELSELADVVNQMTQRFQSTCVILENERADLDRQVRERTREVIQREHLAGVGFLAAGVAHEINNPLASIAWSAEALESRMHEAIHGVGEWRQIAAEQARVLGENLRRIQDEAYRCKGITQRLLDFSRMGNVEKSRVDICELIREVVAMVGTLGQYRCKTLRADCPNRISAMVNGQQIRQVMLNLITNALESVDPDGAVDVQLRQDADRVVVTVRDNGCGMTEEVLEHLFEPFFTRRRDGKGTGLGLSITHRIVTQHGGKLTAHSEGPGKGSLLRLELPIELAAGQLTAAKPNRGGVESLPPLAATASSSANAFLKESRDEFRRVA